MFVLLLLLRLLLFVVLLFLFLLRLARYWRFIQALRLDRAWRFVLRWRFLASGFLFLLLLLCTGPLFLVYQYFPLGSFPFELVIRLRCPFVCQGGRNTLHQIRTIHLTQTVCVRSELHCPAV